MLDPEKAINFDTYEWKVIRMWLEHQKELKIRLLIGADTHDKSQELRGAVKVIDQMLLLEDRARKDRATQTQGNVV